MQELLAMENGSTCFANQVLYNLENRAIELDLFPLESEKENSDNGLFASRPRPRAVE